MGNMTCAKKEAVGHRVKMEPDGVIYHEKQSRELCALHALNNLCQERIFTKRDLDNICYKLSPDAYVNPHKSMFGLGNYDVNVIMAALQTKNLDTVWFDKRKDINGLVLNNIHGLILNIPMDYKWGILHLPLRRKHWIVIRKIGRNYYNLDSKLDLPELIGTPVELRKYLEEQMECNEKELLLIVNQAVSAAASWWRPVPTNQDGPDIVDANLLASAFNDTAPLAHSEDDKSQELEVTIDTHIVSRDVVKKPKYLKKYHQDYVPIEIHHTYHKKSDNRDSKDFTDNVPPELSNDIVPVEVESKLQIVAAISQDQNSKTAELKSEEINGDLSTQSLVTPGVKDKQAENGS